MPVKDCCKRRVKWEGEKQSNLIGKTSAVLLNEEHDESGGQESEGKDQQRSQQLKIKHLWNKVERNKPLTFQANNEISWTINKFHSSLKEK